VVDVLWKKTALNARVAGVGFLLTSNVSDGGSIIARDEYWIEIDHDEPTVRGLWSEQKLLESDAFCPNSWTKPILFGQKIHKLCCLFMCKKV